MSNTREGNDFVRGILIAGETPEVNGVQIHQVRRALHPHRGAHHPHPPRAHQDKLGEYVRTGGTMNGRPAYFKDNKYAPPLHLPVAAPRNARRPPPQHTHEVGRPAQYEPHALVCERGGRADVVRW